MDPRETETAAGGSSRTSPSSHGSERELGCGVGTDFRLDIGGASTVESGYWGRWDCWSWWGC